MLPHTYFTKQSLKFITPFIQARVNASDSNKQLDPSQIDAIKKFPLFLGYTIYKKGEIKFYEKYLSSSIYKQLFTNILAVLSQKNSSKEVTQNIEPSLYNKIKQIKSLYNSELNIMNAQIKSTKIISQDIIEGVFMHRQLNMPSECYSVEAKKEYHTVLRMRNKFNREEHIQLLQRKQSAYNAHDYELQRYYMDSYLNFTRKEKLNRLLIEVNVDLKGKLTTNQANLILPLSHVSPITSHLMQVETIEVPGRAQIERAMVTDIDFIMNGNPFIY